MAESIPQPNRIGRRVMAGRHFGVAHFTGIVAHITGMAAHITGMHLTKRDDGNGTMETR